MQRNLQKEEILINDYVLELSSLHGTSQIQRVLVRRIIQCFFDHLERLGKESIYDFNLLELHTFLIDNFTIDRHLPHEHFEHFAHNLQSDHRNQP